MHCQQTDFIELYSKNNMYSSDKDYLKDGFTSVAAAAAKLLLQCMKVKVKVKSFSCARLLVTPWTAAYQAPPSMGLGKSTGVGCHCPLQIYIYVK